MCCFSGPVTAVYQTKIFARLTGGGQQAIVYSMALDAPADLAMILPLPVKAGSGDDALTFVNLEDYPDFFAHMALVFPQPKAFAAAAAPVSRSAKSILPVQIIGSFEASFVPTAADFSRLDKRFRLPDGTWDQLPGYAGFGFAVFKLKRGSQKVHPMAFTFPTSKPDSIFFPTLHIHDGEVHKEAEFDHVLYCQASDYHFPNWTESEKVPSQTMTMAKTAGLVAPNEHVHRRIISGNKANTDVLVAMS